MMKFGVGQPVPRTEDARLLTGGGRYTDDQNRPGQLHAAFVRSPHAAAKIVSIDADAAREMPGVAAVYTVADLDAAGVGPLPCLFALKNRDGSPYVAPPRPALARGAVRHVGDPVAMVVAESLWQARDAAEAVFVDYADRPSTADTGAALDPAAAQVWEQAPGNLCFDWEAGDEAAADAGFAKAARVVKLDLVNNRVVPNPLEGRACLAWIEDDGRSALSVTSQGVHSLRRQLAKNIFRIPESELRVVTGDVGGGFGMKIFNYPEYVCALFAARALQKPVKWTAERIEGFISDDHGRDHVSHAELALDDHGRFLALKVDTVANLGAYLSTYGPFIPTEAGSSMLAGSYVTPAVYVRVRGAFTHTQPVDAYRGAGRPEAAYLLERLIDCAAREIGLDPAEIRRRNFIPAAAMPHRTSMGQTYDSGDFQQNLDDALALADRAGFADRRRDAAARGKLRGLGLSTYIEACSGGGPEEATVSVMGDGRVVVAIGTQTNGQGHETAYKQILASRFGVAPDRIDVIQGDTDKVAWGSGTGGSRSVPVGGAALAESADRVLTRMRAAAAALLEVAEDAVRFDDGLFRTDGANRTVSFDETAGSGGAADAAVFVETARWTPPASTFPNGCHICELEIDPETGVADVVRYTVVDDFGVVINPLLVQGQIHGGVAQGIGQALHEQVVYDPDNGQLLTASFTDYRLPRAADIPNIDIKLNCAPSTTNALGMKGAGEAGAIGAPPAVINALVDALSIYGVRHVDMPATPLKIWRIIQTAKTATATATA